MSKLEEIITYLKSNPEIAQGSSNVALACVFGCDEGMIRRARVFQDKARLESEVLGLSARNKMLESENEALQARVSVLEAIKPSPRAKKNRDASGQVFFWEIKDEAVPSVPV